MARRYAKANTTDRREDRRQPRPRLAEETRYGIIAVVLFVLAGLSLLSFVDLAGPFGRYVARSEGVFFGWVRFLIPLALIVYGAALLRRSEQALRWSTTLGVIALLLSLTGLGHWYYAGDLDALAAAGDGRGGGYLGYGVAWPLVQVTGAVASLIILVALLLIGILLTFNTSLASLLRRGSLLGRLPIWFQRLLVRNRDAGFAGPRPPETEASDATTFAQRPVGVDEGATSATKPRKGREVSLEDFGLETEPVRGRQRVELPLDLLDNASGKPKSGDIKMNSERIQRTLANFGIPVEMGEVNVGPTVTQYTLKPAEGVKLSQIVTLANDLALALAAHPIRIEAPIPGKSLVGVEVPNQGAALVSLKELLTSEEFRRKKSNLTVCLGKDVAGHAVVGNLDAMPHLLIAGATGSGKSVCINTIILSLLFQNQPDDCKFILVDPKRVELTVYNDISHLITPVITEVQKTVNALKWSVAEMERRYRLLAEAGARNIASFNRLGGGRHLPYLIIMIDELADLMASAAHDVEGAIVRLAQMARAVGIHLVVATQRPSVDVITGLIKANITTRIAFSVASIVDSRTILDSSGAEKLLGNGDMLYVAGDLKKPQRLQGSFVSDEEIKRVVEHLRMQAHPEYEETVVERTASAGESGEGEEVDDDLYEEAKSIVLQAGKASASLLQRRLRVGYARAARLLDIMEERGVIGPLDGARPREVLLSDSAADEGLIDEQIGEKETRPMNDEP